MQRHYKTKTALITGGTRGIGKAIALHLAEIGVVEVFVNYLENDTAAEQTCTELNEKGAKAHLLRFNMAFSTEINAMFEQIREQAERLDYFVHCPALTTFKPLHTVKPNQWDLTMNVSAKSFLHCVQGCVPLMPEGGKIVAISSTGSQRFNPNYGALGIAKSTLESLVRYLAVELAKKKIQINGVVPGMISGDKLPPFPNIEAVVEETLRRTPAGRFGTPEDVAKAVIFLLTQADWMYGQNIILDGGYCLT
jgi:enoyl-[acyl-carrier protein] reductase III